MLEIPTWGFRNKVKKGLPKKYFWLDYYEDNPHKEFFDEIPTFNFLG